MTMDDWIDELLTDTEDDPARDDGVEM